MAYAPYLHYCDAAVPPLGESKDEWEVYWLLSKEMERIAQERNLAPFTDCGDEPIDYKELNKAYSFQGRFRPKDAEGVTAAIIDASPAAGGVTIAELKKKGIHRYVSAGDTIAPTAIFNTDWNGEGVLNPFTYFTKHKWRWPTQTGGSSTTSTIPGSSRPAKACRRTASPRRPAGTTRSSSSRGTAAGAFTASGATRP